MSTDLETSASLYLPTGGQYQRRPAALANLHNRQRQQASLTTSTTTTTTSAAAAAAAAATTTTAPTMALRNKYNTLTPAEAKKLNTRFSLNYSQHNFDSLSTASCSLGRRVPLRTASVMHKPRPPPLVVTDLDSDELDSDFGLSAGSSTASRPAPGHHDKAKSCSKTSLSSATYRVFQGPYANFKRFMRNMPRLPFSSSSPVPTVGVGNQNGGPSFAKQAANGDSRQSLEESISQLCFNRSQSPPRCPPPPGELKSMSYMEDSVNYSNYDDFTRARNEQLNTWHGPRSTIASRRPVCLSLTPNKPNFDVYSAASSSDRQTLSTEFVDAISNSNTTTTTTNNNNNTLLDSTASDESWQLASLPVAYERNLTTVCEDTKRRHWDLGAGPTRARLDEAGAGFDEVDRAAGGGPPAPARKSSLQVEPQPPPPPPPPLLSRLITPPHQFDDSVERARRQRQPQGAPAAADSEDLSLPNDQRAAPSPAGSSQSLASTTTADSVLDYHRQTATKFRFSFAQAPPAPPSVNGKDVGLPPRMPQAGPLASNGRLGAAGKQHHQVVDTSSGNSSNNSSQLNGIDDCDKHLLRLQSRADSEALKLSQKVERFVELSGAAGESDRISFSLDHHRGGDTGSYANEPPADSANDHDVTLLSDTSTILGADHAQTNPTLAYANKCAELERKVAFLENKLANKEKKLTDLQLSHFRKDDTIDRLRIQVNKLEKENGRLRMAMMVSSGSTNHYSDHS